MAFFRIFVFSSLPPRLNIRSSRGLAIQWTKFHKSIKKKQLEKLMHRIPPYALWDRLTLFTLKEILFVKAHLWNTSRNCFYTFLSHCLAVSCFLPYKNRGSPFWILFFLFECWVTEDKAALSRDDSSSREGERLRGNPNWLPQLHSKFTCV